MKSIALRNKEKLRGALQIDYDTIENIALWIAFGNGALESNALSIDSLEPLKICFRLQE